MFRVELIGGPHDGRQVNLPNLVNEVHVPNPIPIDILYFEQAFNPDTFEPPTFTSSAYKSDVNVDKMTIEYNYNGEVY